MKKVLFAALLLFIQLNLCGPAKAILFEIDFNDLALGEVLTDQYATSNVTFSLLDTPQGEVLGPVATRDGTYASFGNMVTPGNNHRDPFYDINISFSQPIDYFSFLAFDADEPVTTKGYYNGSLVQSQTYGPGTNEQIYDMQLGAIGGSIFLDTVIIDLVSGTDPNSYDGGPEWFDNLAFNTADPRLRITSAPHATPEPTTILLLGTGLVGLAGFSRKKARRRA